MLQLRRAIEASWNSQTAYLGVSEEGNPALGNCYPTSRVVQHYFPEMEIVEGWVSTGEATEKHFWNVLVVNGTEYHTDLTWAQFPHGSHVLKYQIRDRRAFDDSEDTVRRVELLLERVQGLM